MDAVVLSLANVEIVEEGDVDSEPVMDKRGVVVVFLRSSG